MTNGTNTYTKEKQVNIKLQTFPTIYLDSRKKLLTTTNLAGAVHMQNIMSSNCQKSTVPAFYVDLILNFPTVAEAGSGLPIAVVPL